MKRSNQRRRNLRVQRRIGLWGVNIASNGETVGIPSDAGTQAVRITNDIVAIREVD